MFKNNLITIVIVSYKSKKKVLKFLNRIGNKFKIIIIENSNDLTIKREVNKNFNNVDISNKTFIKNIILEIKNTYEDRWKSLNKLNTTIELPIRLSVDSNNIELSNKLEKTLMNLDFVSDFKIERFNNDEIIYKIIFNSTPQRFLENIMISGFKIDTTKSIWKIK